MRTGPYKGLYHPEQLLSAKEDAASNFARCYYSMGGPMERAIMQRISKVTEDCDGLQGFFVYHSLGGGTGTGLTALLLEQLACEYPKKSRLEFLVYPSPKVCRTELKCTFTLINFACNVFLCNRYIIPIQFFKKTCENWYGVNANRKK